MHFFARKFKFMLWQSYLKVSGGKKHWNSQRILDQKNAILRKTAMEANFYNIKSWIFRLVPVHLKHSNFTLLVEDTFTNIFTCFCVHLLNLWGFKPQFFNVTIAILILPYGCVTKNRDCRFSGFWLVQICCCQQAKMNEVSDWFIFVFTGQPTLLSS